MHRAMLCLPHHIISNPTALPSRHYRGAITAFTALLRCHQKEQRCQGGDVEVALAKQRPVHAGTQGASATHVAATPAMPPCRSLHMSRISSSCGCDRLTKPRSSYHVPNPANGRQASHPTPLCYGRPYLGPKLSLRSFSRSSRTSTPQHGCHVLLIVAERLHVGLRLPGRRLQLLLSACRGILSQQPPLDPDCLSCGCLWSACAAPCARFRV